jgi:hypothetical protein
MTARPVGEVAYGSDQRGRLIRATELPLAMLRRS